MTGLEKKLNLSIDFHEPWQFRYFQSACALQMSKDKKGWIGWLSTKNILSQKKSVHSYHFWSRTDH